MSELSIVIPSNNHKLAAAIGRALVEYGEDQSPVRTPLLTPSLVRTATDDKVREMLGSKDATVETTSFPPADDLDGPLGVLSTAADDDIHAGPSVALRNAIIDGDDDAIREEQAKVKPSMFDEPAADTPVDVNGVAKNPEFCANAAKPFYSSGKREGQWKKKGGAGGPTDEQYDNWYADADRRKTPAAAEPAKQAADEIDSAAAFGNGGHADTSSEPIPTTAGEYMAWAAEKQAAGLLTQDDIQNAFENCDVTMPDLFPEGPATAAAVANLYRTLSAKVNA